MPRPQYPRALLDMRWLVPSLAILSFALTAFAGFMVLKSSSASELGEIDLLAGIAVLVISALLILNILLALKDFHRN
jgi:predicted RND superfamily exporter protein